MRRVSEAPEGRRSGPPRKTSQPPPVPPTGTRRFPPSGRWPRKIAIALPPPITVPCNSGDDPSPPAGRTASPLPFLPVRPGGAPPPRGDRQGGGSRPRRRVSGKRCRFRRGGDRRRRGGGRRNRRRGPPVGPDQPVPDRQDRHGGKRARDPPGPHPLPARVHPALPRPAD